MRLINIINFFVWKFRLQKQRPSKYDRPSHSTDFDCTGPSKTKSLEIWPTAPLYPTLCLYEQSCCCIQTVNVNSGVELSIFDPSICKGEHAGLRCILHQFMRKRNHSLLHKDWPGKKVTIYFPIFYWVKSSENILFLCLHFTWLCGSWNYQRILKKWPFWK